jgi:ribonuclease E
MTRKRVGEGLLEAFSETCEVCKGRGVIIAGEPVDKPTSAREDEERPAGKGKRKRGGRGNGKADASEPAELSPAASEEQRKAANAAIAAIHRAAALEGEEDGEPNLIESLAGDLVEAAAASAQPTPDEPTSGEPTPDEPIEPAAMVVIENDVDEAATQTDDSDQTPAPRRRRRGASRPAGPPGAA